MSLTPTLVQMQLEQLYSVWIWLLHDPLSFKKHFNFVYLFHYFKISTLAMLDFKELRFVEDFQSNLKFKKVFFQSNLFV
jgi:hypothetical protein